MAEHTRTNEPSRATRPADDEHRRDVVVVTGSSGTLGSRTIDALKDRYQVIGLDRDGQPQPPPQVECIVMEMTDPQSVELAFERIATAYGTHLAALVHLAAYVDFAEQESPMYDNVTVDGSRLVIETMHRLGFTCERIVFSSTMLVHAPTRPGRPIDEESPMGAKWGYPRSKIRAEQEILQAAGSTPTVFLRIAGAYTESGGAPTIAHQIERIASGSPESRLLPGDPDHGQAFVHLNDAIDAIRLAVDKRADLPRHASYLIGEPVTFSYQQLQDAIGQELHGSETWRTMEIPRSVARAGAAVKQAVGTLPGFGEPFIKPFMIDMADDHYELDISRAERELGWEPAHRLIDTIPAMCRRRKLDPEGFRRENGID